MNIDVGKTHAVAGHPVVLACAADLGDLTAYHRKFFVVHIILAPWWWKHGKETRQAGESCCVYGAS